MRLLILILITAQLAVADAPDWRRPVATYSIVARDSLSGQLGVAVQSHWFSVGPIVPWARPGVGAVATQSLVDPAYGPLGLELMAMGKTARQRSPLCLRGMPMLRCGKWPWSMPRECGRSHGRAGHCRRWPSDRCSDSVQANLMDQDSVWPAMAHAYENAEGDLRSGCSWL